MLLMRCLTTEVNNEINKRQESLIMEGFSRHYTDQRRLLHWVEDG